METKHTIKIVLELLQHVLRFVMDREEGQWRTKKHARFIKRFDPIACHTHCVIAMHCITEWMDVFEKQPCLERGVLGVQYPLSYKILSVYAAPASIYTCPN